MRDLLIFGQLLALAFAVFALVLILFRIGCEVHWLGYLGCILLTGVIVGLVVVVWRQSK